MCGIAGFHAEGVNDAEEICRAMLSSIAHRGPDGDGVHRDGATTFGHRRLAIIDVGEGGHQPMVSHDGHLVISYNGELYNYRELRGQLEVDAPIRWRGSSDTEVMLEAIARWGLSRALARFNGMFAFALLDRRSGEIALARDRFGEKPLYWQANTERLVFGSELRAIEACELLPLHVSRTALLEQLQRAAVPAPLSIYDAVEKLAPASVLRWRPGKEPTIECYWSIESTVREAIGERFEDEDEAVAALEEALTRSVELRMVSDVPLGAFLSGGVDSSLVVALMQRLSSRPVETFSIGFDVAAFDESEHARAVAAHLGTNHHEQIVSGADALAIVPELGTLFDEPFSDASQVPTCLVSRLARRHVNVALSGDGGDELFCGYKRYFSTPAMWRAMNRVPLRRTVGAALARTPAAALDRVAGGLRRLTDRHGRPGRVGPKLRRFGRWMQADSLDELYGLNHGRLLAPGSLLAGEVGRGEPIRLPDWLEGAERMAYADTIDYLPNDILAKVDRAAMASSLETRVPLLDPEVLSLAWRLPLSMKVRGGQGKHALREVLYRHVPRGLIERPKIGFGAPIGSWLRGPLREWSSDLLAPDRLRRQGLYDAQAVDALRRAHLSERDGDEHAGKLWAILMTQSWLDADPRRVSRIG